MGDWEDDSEDEDESATVPKPPEDDVCTEPSPVSHLTHLVLEQEDPVIEYEDEFGRQRTARRSEVPRHLLPRDPDEEPPEEDIEYVTQ